MTKMKFYQKLVITLSLGLSLLGCGGVGSDTTKTKDLPVAVNDAPIITKNSTENNILVLANDTTTGKLDVSSVKITTPAKEGITNIESTGEIKYTPRTGFDGTDSFNYTVQDIKGNFSNIATVTITVPSDNPPTISITTNPITIRKGATITHAEIIAKAEVIATDDIDGTISIDINSNTIDTKNSGTYKVIFSATDSVGQTTLSAPLDAIVVAPSEVTRDHTHSHCPGGITTVWYDMNLNGVYDNNIEEFESESTSYGPNVKDPVTETTLRDMISKNQDITGENTCEIEDMSLLFIGKTTFNQDISGWNVGSVKNMVGMFQNASAFNGDISSWNVGSVTNMRAMFRGASAFDGNISDWNVTSVKFMNYMFFDATKFTGINMKLWGDKVANVEDMSYMFSGALLFNEDIGDWNVSSVKLMNYMFFNAKIFQGLNFDSWRDNVRNVENMNYMFSGAEAFNGNISQWNVSSVTNMSSMFNGAIAFNGDIGDWLVGKVTMMHYMFNDAIAFNGNIDLWDVSSVTKMEFMFFNATSFLDHDLSGWSVSNVTTHENFFSNQNTSNIEPNWP